jgi:hypothetical protein
MSIISDFQDRENITPVMISNSSSESIDKRSIATNLDDKGNISLIFKIKNAFSDARPEGNNFVFKLNDFKPMDILHNKPSETITSTVHVNNKAFSDSLIDNVDEIIISDFEKNYEKFRAVDSRIDDTAIERYYDTVPGTIKKFRETRSLKDVDDNGTKLVGALVDSKRVWVPIINMINDEAINYGVNDKLESHYKNLPDIINSKYMNKLKIDMMSDFSTNVLSSMVSALC